MDIGEWLWLTSCVAVGTGVGVYLALVAALFSFERILDTIVGATSQDY